MIDTDERIHDPEEVNKNVLKSYTQTVNKNLTAVQEYAKESRRMLRDLEAKVMKLQVELLQKNTEIQQLNVRIAQLQAKTFNGATTV